MRLLFYLTRFPAFGGIETVTEVVCSYLVKTTRYEIDILTHFVGDKCSDILQNAHLYKMPDEGSWTSFRNIEYAKQIIDSGNYDAIIYQDSYAPTEGLICNLADHYSIPLYVFEHSNPLGFKATNNEYSFLHPLESVKNYLIQRKRLYQNTKRRRYLLQYCKKYVLLSKNFISEIGVMVKDPILLDKVTYINNPIIYTPIPEDKRRKKENIILTVCQLAKVKNVNIMLQIWKKICTKLPDWKFVVVGDGTEKESLLQQIKDNNISNVEFTGYADPVPYYEKAKIFWMTSKYEGWGMTIVESMQKGCVPLVLNTFLSLTDIVQDGINGIVVNKDDLSDFANKTVSLAENPTAMNELAINAIAHSAKFNIDNIITAWENLLHSQTN